MTCGMSSFVATVMMRGGCARELFVGEGGEGVILASNTKLIRWVSILISDANTKKAFRLATTDI